MSAEFLQNLLRGIFAEPRVHAAFLSGDLLEPSSHELDEMELHLAVERSFRREIGEWLPKVGELVYSGADSHGWTAVTPDGVEWRFHFHTPDEPVPTEGTQRLFDRRPAPHTPAPPERSELDLAALAGRFWCGLYRAARALERNHTLIAHRWLQSCGGELIQLYRLALAPGTPGDGWEGADAIPGLSAALEPVRDALVAPLEGRAQRRSAYRLATAYEGLMLPLCERLGIVYPMEMRNLVFQRLDLGRARDGAAQGALSSCEGQVPPGAISSGGPEPASLPKTVASGRLRVVKGRIRRRED